MSAGSNKVAEKLLKKRKTKTETLLKKYYKKTKTKKSPLFCGMNFAL